jgi:delta1-piperideine-2-carboxylate reductase
MTTTSLTLDEIHELAKSCLMSNGANEVNATAVADNMTNAERDGSHSHGLFRLPAHVAALRSGKVKGDAEPKASVVSPSLVKLHGDNAFAPLAQKIGIPLVAEAAKKSGVAVLALTHVHHMAALWPEVEAVAEHDLVGLACTCYMPAVAPAGAAQALFGTNPLAFAWPRPGNTPVVFDMATAAMAMGEVQIAARDGHDVPPGTGLDANGDGTTDPKKITDGGVLLPFGGHKGSAIAMMVELLAAGLLGESFSFEAKERDNGDGGPPQGGQFILALSPEMIASQGWQAHCNGFLERMSGMDGVRMPGERRHKNRLSIDPRNINTALVEKIRGLIEE